LEKDSVVQISPAVLRYFDILKYRIFKCKWVSLKRNENCTFQIFGFYKVKCDIFTRNTHDVFNQGEWIREWKGQVFLSHGSSVSAGVAVLSAG